MFAFKNMASNTVDPVAEVEVAHDGLALAVHESFVEIEGVNGTLPVAMSNVYEMWAMDDTRTVEEKQSVMEGVLSDAGTKIKNFFKKLAEKIKAWWKSVVKYFQTIFSSNKNFLDKYGDELRGKDTSDFSYEGHKWNPKTAGDMLEKAVKFAAGFNLSLDGQLKLTDEKKKIDSALGAKSPSDFCTKLRKEAGAERKSTIKNFSGVASVGEMIDYVSDGGNKDIERLEEVSSQMSAALDKRGDEIADAMEKVKDDVNKTANYRVLLGATKYAFSYATQSLSAAKGLYASVISEYSGVLRALARHTSKEEKEAKKRVTESAGLLSVWGGEF